MVKQPKIHRWQPTGYTPCGLKIKGDKLILTNVGYWLSEGVTCKTCKRATTLISLLGDEWNGQSDGEPKAND